MTKEEFLNLRSDGNRGFQDLCHLVEELGYRNFPQQLQNNNGTFVSSLTNFLEDNPGAIQSIYDWIEENYEEELSEEQVEECSHENIYVNDRSQTVCLDCDEELGR